MFDWIVSRCARVRKPPEPFNSSASPVAALGRRSAQRRVVDARTAALRRRPVECASAVAPGSARAAALHRRPTARGRALRHRPGRPVGSRTSRRSGRAWPGTPRPGRLRRPASRSAAMTSAAVCSARWTWRASDASVCSNAATVAGRQMVQLDPAAAAAEQPLGGERVQRQGPGAPRVVGVEPGAAGLVVDDHQLAADVVDPVDPAGQGQGGGLGAHRALDRDRLEGRGLGPPGSCPSQDSARRYAARSCSSSR